MDAVCIRELRKRYRNGIQALDGLELSVKEGEIFSLLGPNGAGKSTLLRILTTCLRPDAGKLSIMGRDPVKDPAGVRPLIACVAQQPSIDTYLSLEENMMFQSRLYRVPGAVAKKRMQQLIRDFGLQDYLKYPVSSYSGGIKRRLDIAMNMMPAPRILFLDEPTTGLDIQSRIAMWEMMEKIRRDFETTIFLTTHYLEEADSLSNTICIIREGKRVIQDTPSRLKDAFTIIVTLLQPFLWLVLYGTAAGETMKSSGIGSYTAFLLPGLMVLVCFSACGSGGMINYRLKREGSFYRILTAPVSRSSIVLGQLLEAVLCAFLETGILTAVSFFFGVRFRTGFSGLLLILLLLFLTAFFMAGLTYSVSLVLPNEAVYDTVMNAIVLPVFFLSSALFPAGGNSVLAAVVDANPFTHMIDVLRSLMLTGTAVPGRLLFTLALFALLCGCSFLWALSRLQAQTRQ